MLSPILVLMSITALLVLDFDPKPYGVESTSASYATSQVSVSNTPHSHLPSNICRWSWPIERVNSRPVTTLNDVARIVARLGHEHTEEVVFPASTKDTIFSPVVLMSHPSHVITFNPIKTFTAPLFDDADSDQIGVEFPSMYLLVRYLIRCKLKLSHFWDALSVAMVSALFTVYLKLAKAFWGLHNGYEVLYGPMIAFLTRRQHRRVTHQSKSRQTRERANHVENVKYFQSVFNHGLTIVIGYKARLADETRRNVELSRTLAIQTSLCAAQGKTISNLELERNLQEQRYQRKMDDIDALNEWVQNGSALRKAKDRELDAQRDLINRLKQQIKEDEVYYVRQITHLDQSDFDLKMDGARHIQRGLEATIAKKDVQIDNLKIQTVSMTDEMNHMKTELLQTACNQAQVDAIKQEMEQMRMELKQMRSTRKEYQLIMANLTTESASLKEKALGDETKANSEIERLRSTQKAAEQAIVMLQAESASLKEKAQTDALKNDLQMEQMRMGCRADKQTITTLLAESASLSEKSERDDQEIARLSTINAAQGAEITNMNAMLTGMCQFANSQSPVSQGSTDTSTIPSPSTSEGSVTTVVEAGGPSLAQLLSEVEASRSEVMDVSPKETHVEQPPLALAHECTSSSAGLTHDRPPFSWDFTNVSTQPLDAEFPAMFDGLDIFSNLTGGLPIQNQAIEEIPAFLGSAEDMWNAAMALDFPQIPTANYVNEVTIPISDNVTAEIPTFRGATEGNGIITSPQGPQIGSDFVMTDSCQLPSIPTPVVTLTFNNISSGLMEVEQGLASNSSQPPIAPISTHPSALDDLSLPAQLDNPPLAHSPSGSEVLDANQPCIEQPAVRGLAAAVWAANPSGNRPIRKIRQGLRATAPPPSITQSPVVTESTTTEILNAQVLNLNNTPVPAPTNSAGGVVSKAVVASRMDVFQSTAKPLGRKQVGSSTASPAPVASTSESTVSSDAPKKPTPPKPRGRSVLSAGLGGKLSVTTRN